ncbi:MAG: acyl-CoA thioesterase [Alphaproteobacteria bacterium]
MAGWIETYRGIVYPWQCDHQGHLTAMHYLGMFDQGGWHVLNACGLATEALIKAGRGFANVKDTLEYLAELHVGALVAGDGCLARVGTTSLTIVQRLRNAATGELAARGETVAVHFDLAARLKLPIPDDLRARLAAHVVNQAAL